jgi:pyrroloquinoline-quinone synthase
MDTLLATREPLTPAAFEEALRGQVHRYHHIHPFHLAMHEGRLSRPQVQHWVANRYYYQQIVPKKDAAILSNCPDPAIRRVWIERLHTQDGTADGQGGLESWLHLAEAVGLAREEVLDERHVVPGVRFAADAYLTFTRTQPWTLGVAASLTELFAPDLMRERLAAFAQHYAWVDATGLAYFQARIHEAPEESAFALKVVQQYAVTRQQQDRALGALRFKCDVLWSLLDAIEHTAQALR